MRNLIAVAVFSLALAATGWGATINVPGDYGTIQEAVDAANAGDVILVAPGNYADVTHDPGDGIMTAVIMRSDITLRGSGQTQTILDADSTGRFIHCEGVTGVTIRNLRIRRAFAEIFGAGILAKDQSSVDIVDVTFEDCGDGAIISLNSTTQIQTCTFNNNLAKQGGGISIELGSTTTTRPIAPLPATHPRAEGGYSFVTAKPRSCAAISPATSSRHRTGPAGGSRSSTPQPISTSASSSAIPPTGPVEEWPSSTMVM